jgi:DNA helicase-2/ATP-dependent DNA helicase PcrA
VVDIFLTHFTKSKKKNIIGFFGDAMQSIYDDGIGNLDDYKDEKDGVIKEIKKEQNRRNPQKIIDLANQLRTDGIEQIPSKDENAPNMFNGVVKDGSVLFLYSSNGDVEKVKKFLKDNSGWDFSNSKETKELNLTHNLIAGKVGFRALMDIYDSDPIMGLKKDILNKIKDNKKNNKPEIEILEDDTFDNIVDKFQLKNRQRQLKKDILLADPANKLLYDQLKHKAFSEVRKMYITKDALVDDKKQNEEDENKKGSKRDNLIKHLFKIQTNISLYQNGNFNEFLRVTDYRYRILRIADKRTLKKNIEELSNNVGDKTIEDVINDADDKGICISNNDSLNSFKIKNEYLYNRVKDVKFSEFQNLYKYLEGQTLFSTQHKTKGSEFDNVLVILDNGRWNDYNFEYLFFNSGTQSVLERTQKIFYVCCTRAKENLAVFYHNPSAQVIMKAKEWFGEENVIDI